MAKLWTKIFMLYMYKQEYTVADASIQATYDDTTIL